MKWVQTKVAMPERGMDVFFWVGEEPHCGFRTEGQWKSDTGDLYYDHQVQFWQEADYPGRRKKN